MITQNTIIGHAKKKLGGLYARTLYGKNIIQSCPPPNKEKLAPSQKAAQSAFGRVSLLSNQVPASLLNQIYYSAPIGRSRRQQWNKNLMKGLSKIDGSWTFQPNLIEILGSNPKVSEEAYNLILPSTQVEIPISDLSAVNNAITTETPCIILISPEPNICISLLPYTSIVSDNIVLQNLSTTLVEKNCWLFPLWKVNIGTQQTPIYTYGRYEK